MHIYERVIIGYKKPEYHDDLKDLTVRQREEYWKKEIRENKLHMALYLLRVMKREMVVSWLPTTMARHFTATRLFSSSILRTAGP